MSDTCTPLDLFYDDLDWCEEHLSIIAKSTDIVPLRWNPMQEKVNRAAIGRLKQGRPIRLIILKARQHGISTQVQAWKHARSHRRSGIKAFLLSHTDESKRKIWGMQRIFLKYGRTLPYVSNFGAIEGPLIWNHDSMLTCATARGEEIGHGETITFLHASEVSRYGEGQSPDQQQRAVAKFSELLGAVAKTPDSVVVLESTANGYGEMFEQMYHKAEAGEIDYTPVFIAWWENPEYIRPLSFGPIHHESDLDPVELGLRDQFKLSLEQLNWRRDTIASDCNGDVRMFQEKYPASAEEAFLVSGSTVFDPERIKAYLEAATPPVWRGDIDYVPPEFEHDTGRWELHEDPRGPLRIWERPDEMDAYAIGADPAVCRDTRSDRDAAVIRSGKSLDVVATFAGHLDPGVFALKLAALGYYYNTALLAPENNAVGEAVVGTLMGRLGGPQIYHNVYRYSRTDKATGLTQIVYGFPTSVKTKHAAIEAEKAMIRDGSERCPCVDVLTEAKTFVNMPNGKMGAQTGCRDDLVMAWCISALVVNNVVVPVKEEPKPRRAADLLTEAVTSEDLIGFQ